MDKNLASDFISTSWLWIDFYHFEIWACNRGHKVVDDLRKLLKPQQPNITISMNNPWSCIFDLWWNRHCTRKVTNYEPLLWSAVKFSEGKFCTNFHHQGIINNLQKWIVCSNIYNFWRFAGLICSHEAHVYFNFQLPTNLMLTKNCTTFHYNHLFENSTK